jgi:hypothetical protein
MSTRAQAFSLEAFVASILLVATLSFALQSVAITSNTAGGPETQLRGQHAGITEGILDGAVDNGNLKTTLVYWDESTERFHGSDEDEGIYISESPNTTFGQTLRGMLADQQLRYNVDLYYRDADGDRARQGLVEYGTPSHDAVRVTETVTLYDNTTLVTTDETPRENATLETVEGGFYAPDAATDSPVYNVIHVEVVVWQI